MDAGALLAEGAVRLDAGRLRDARWAHGAAVKAAAAAGDDDTFVRAALGLGGLWVYEQRESVERAALEVTWQRAGELVRPGSVAELALRARVAAEAVYEGGPDAPVEAAVDALRGRGDDVALAEALSLLHHVRLGPAHAEGRLALAEELLRVSVKAGAPHLVLMGLCWRTVDLLLLGDPRAGRSLRELRERADAADCLAISFVADVLDAMSLARAGHFDLAEAAADAALERGESAGDADALNYWAAMVAALRRWQGRPGEVLTLVREASSSPRLGPNDYVYVAADATVSALVGDLEGAEGALDRLVGIGLDTIPQGSSWLTGQLLVAEAAFRLERPDVAEEVARLVAPFAHLPVMASIAVVCFGSARRALGLAAATLGDLDGAILHFEVALTEDRRLGNRPAAAAAEHELSWLRRARRGDGDDVAADRSARHAIDHASRLGMVLDEPPAWLRAVPAPSRAPGARNATLARRSSGWELALEGRTTVFADRVGFRYLVCLLAAPGAEVDVGVLVTGDHDLVPPTTQHLLDAEARRSYETRARELGDLLARSDVPDAEALRDELEVIADALRAGTGLWGRARAFPAERERARTSVRKAILRAIETIAAAEPEVGAHLRRSITTGARCRYVPAPGWTVRQG